MWMVLAGAFLVAGGVLYMLWEALGRRELSAPRAADSARPGENGSRQTIEPQHQGLAFLGLARNWPAVAMMAGGAALLLFGAV